MRTRFRFGLVPAFFSRWLLILSFLLAVVFASRGAAQSGKAEAQSNSFDSASVQTSPSQVAQPPQANPVPEAPEGTVNLQSEGGKVEIDGQVILTVYQSIGSFSSKDRAAKIRERILDAAKKGTDPSTVTLIERPMWAEISGGGNLLLAVSDEDAAAAGKTRAQLATEDVASIREALLRYRSDHAWKSVVRGIIYSLIATLVLLPIGYMLRRFRLLVTAFLERWIKDRTDLEQKKTAFHVATTYIVSTVLALGSVVRWLVLIAIFEVYVTVLLSFFPQTRSVSHLVTDWIFAALQSLGKSALDYLPNLFVIAVVILVASQVSRLITMVFDEIGKGNLSFKGFYPEWAQPSAKLIKLLVYVLVLVVIFPYLPGSKSPAFQGISIFVGVLLSLGSSSAVANAIAGVILTYMRSFSVGDWVKIGDTLGEVHEKSMWVTRILTPKHEIITIPNATVMNGSVMNYTREAQKSGVIFYTTVTIGYDAAWKTVHQLLIDAAFATEHVLHNPPPFVLQTQLNDFYVSYELNAYTDTPRRMQFIYSELHQNIQDRFNDAGVEICSPHFNSLRDGNAIALPAKYISKDYEPSAFRVTESKKDSEPEPANR
jgi:small-conductance mechanosensitive channel